MRQTVRLTGYHFRRWRSKRNVPVAFVFFLILADMFLRGIRKLIPVLGVRPEVTAFPLLWNSTLFLMLFFFGVMLYFSDAPFSDPMSDFLFIRCGRICCTASHLCYIVLSAPVITAAMFLIEFLCLPGGVCGEWGKFWGTVAQTNVAAETGGRMAFQYHILWDFTPGEALFATAALCILLCILTGLTMYFFGRCGLRTAGMCVLAVFLILPHIVRYLNFTTFYWLSPWSWICLDTTMRQYNGSLPSIGYAFGMLVFLDVVLAAAILLGDYSRVFDRVASRR